MKIYEQYRNLELLETIPFLFVGRDGVQEKREESVLKEHLMDIVINGALTMKLICIPQYLSELVLGRMLTEGIITSADEVEQIYICKYGSRAVVILNRPQKAEPAQSDIGFVEVTPTCCTGNRILNDRFFSGSPLKPVTPILWNYDQVFSLADRFSNGMPLHSQTWATHSCFLAKEGEILFSCEDIGRHNALDKVIGYALRHRINLTECIVYSSGRIPTDMVTKVIRAGIPVFCSKASPTQEAVAIANTYRLTLVCAARRDRMKLFAGVPPADYQEDETNHGK